MRKPAPATRRIVQSASLPAPIAGWNARDALDLMGPADAIVLDNWYPAENWVELRRGHGSYGTGLTNTVETILEYAHGATRKMFAATSGGEIFDCSSAGSGSESVTGLTNGRLQAVNFGTSGGNFLWCANGVDAPQHFDGSAWAAPTLTGVTAADIVSPTVFKRRLFFVLKDSLKFGYLPVVSIAGAVATFDLAGLFSKGGKLKVIGTWSRDGGSGPDDLIAFITDQGEVAIYAGDDPSDAASWGLQGVFLIGAPIGDRSTIKVGADLFIITIDGYVPLSKVLPQDRAGAQAAISDKIRGAVIERARTQKDTFGWQPVLYPKGGFGLFNVPKGSSKFEQHVVNVNTGAWCRFTGMNANCWGIYNDALYFGGDGVVYKADTGTDDNGSAINADGKTAFSNYGNPGMVKRFTQIRPVMSSDGDLPVTIAFNVDFGDEAATYTPSSTTSSGPKWDAVKWDTVKWGKAVAPVASWQGVEGIGYTGSVRVRTSTTAQSVRWHSSDVMFEVGGGL